MAPLAAAQEVEAADPDETTLDEVVVTGSRIRRDPTNAPTPLIQVTGEALLSSGQNTIIDTLATLPALSQSTVPSDTTGSNLNDGGQSFANLRALGANRTLTLVDGRRHVGSNGGTLSVDVDAIPRLLIENVEIVTGGASSVYGADAVSGVLNFVLRKDFEGLQIDANYGMINQDGQANKRVSVLAGANLLDDRLNLWAFGEYEDIDEVQVLDIDWLEESWLMAAVDSDPTSAAIGPANDGLLDLGLYSNVRTLSRPRWGRTVLANMQVPSRLDDPEVPFNDCSTTAAFNAATNNNCFNLQPGKTYIYEGLTGRLANFGQRVGTAGVNRTNNIGGDGSNPAEFGQISRVGHSESSRFAVGANFQITDAISGTLEAKYIEEQTFDTSQPVFFDVNISDRRAANVTSIIRTNSQFDVRLSDNAFLPTNVKTAIQNNMLVRYTQPTNTADGTPLPEVAAPFARHALFGPNRSQDNTRTLQRIVGGLRGEYDRIGFINDATWDLSYTYGEYEGLNRERGVDILRFALAADAVVDTAGAVNGRPGEIVCRAQLVRKTNPVGLDDYALGGKLTDTAEGIAAIDQCAPLNVFGEGNQSEAALAYVDATINVRERNEQEDAIASFSGSLWDMWGAGPLGFAIGAEYRREFTSAIGRNADTGRRLLFLNTGPDFVGAEYDSQEYFGELSVPLFRDSFMGEYAELSGSYRTAKYSTVGNVEVYGVNLVYRPIPDIAIKTSLNSSIRVPSLGENFAPRIQTFQNAFVDPCATAQINAAGLSATFRQNRISNCTAQAAAKGLAFDFAGATATNTDDFAPVYSGGIAGVVGGNPDLKPEESTSFTFSTVLRPRFIPDFSLVLDYYEIVIEDVISAPTAQVLANNCVNGLAGNPQCNQIFRDNPNVVFGMGGTGPLGGFVQQSINLAKLQTRGMDFTARYRLDIEEHTGHNWGRLDYALTGSWLLEQKTFLDQGNPASFTELASTLNATAPQSQFPRVRFTSSLTWTPNDIWSVNWSVDWQSAQNIVFARDLITNADARDPETYNTGNFARHDLTFRWNVQDNLSVRAGVVNLFDAEQARYLGTTMFDNFDPYGTRFFFGFNYTPY